MAGCKHPAELRHPVKGSPSVFCLGCREYVRRHGGRWVIE